MAEWNFNTIYFFKNFESELIKINMIQKYSTENGMKSR